MTFDTAVGVAAVGTGNGNCVAHSYRGVNIIVKDPIVDRLADKNGVAVVAGGEYHIFDSWRGTLERRVRVFEDAVVVDLAITHKVGQTVTIQVTEIGGGSAVAVGPVDAETNT